MATEQAQRMVCYRHPGTETSVSCSNCGRPICTDCMVFAAVGIKCPECAGQPTGVKRATTRARRAAGEGTGSIVTKALIAVNTLVFVLQISQGDIRGTSGDVFREGAVSAGPVADGEWWRLVTAGFLHVGLPHLVLNMLALWWFGGALEAALGRARFVTLYVVSLLAGSAGALLVSPDVPTAGASGAVYGVFGAGLFLERRGMNVFGGAALLIILFNLLFTLANADRISVGGHIGGLIAGMLAMAAFSGFGRGHAIWGRVGLVEAAGLAGIVLASLGLAYFRVRGYA